MRHVKGIQGAVVVPAGKGRPTPCVQTAGINFEVREAALVVSGTTDAYDAALEKPIIGSRLAALNGESCVGEAPDVVMERLRNASRPLELEFWSRGVKAS